MGNLSNDQTTMVLHIRVPSAGAEPEQVGPLPRGQECELAPPRTNAHLDLFSVSDTTTKVIMTNGSKKFRKRSPSLAFESRWPWRLSRFALPHQPVRASVRFGSIKTAGRRLAADLVIPKSVRVYLFSGTFRSYPVFQRSASFAIGPT